MIEIKKNYIDNKTEKAILVGIRRASHSRLEVEDHMNELKELARTAGAEVVKEFVQERINPNKATFIGKGKLEEVVKAVEELEVTLVIFDDELTPAQVKNITGVLAESKLEDTKVIDRTALILDIFADHAQTSESKTQVELAQLNYLLPRLTRAWTHLSRQVGGIGTKGPGETQLETDRRLVRTRISKLQENLKAMEKQNEIRRLKRDSMFRVALIGYTNAGKSTLMHALSDADVLIEDKLFATLDTTVRKVQISDSLTVLMSDTVGFIRKLPHQLVASFRSTLAESNEADLLLHVVDISHPHYEDHIDVVNTLLAEVGNEEIPRILVFNKMDLMENGSEMEHVRSRHDNAIFISAARHIGLSNLKTVINKNFENEYLIKDIQLNFTKGGGEHLILSFATILEKHYTDTSVVLKIKYHKENDFRLSQILDKN